MRRLVVLSGAGISAESGLKTFRDEDGLWEGYNVYDVATPEAWAKNPHMVQEFYNLRRKAVREAQPNAAHIHLAQLQEFFDVHIITQNIDDLHERAGSRQVMHLHGEILKSRSTIDSTLIYQVPGWELKMGDCCEMGSQLRPHIVWFGEEVPLIEEAARVVESADVFVVIGTSLAVYPAAGLIRYASYTCEKYLIDPKPAHMGIVNQLTIIEERATRGTEILLQKLT